jgi:hypothetical protein
MLLLVWPAAGPFAVLAGTAVATTAADGLGVVGGGGGDEWTTLS